MTRLSQHKTLKLCVFNVQINKVPSSYWQSVLQYSCDAMQSHISHYHHYLKCIQNCKNTVGLIL